MKTEKVVLISCSADWESRFGVESIGLALCKAAIAQGGKAWAGWTDKGLKVRLQGVPRNVLHKYLSAYFESVQKHSKSLSVAEQDAIPTSIPDVAAGEIPWGTVMSVNGGPKVQRVPVEK